MTFGHCGCCATSGCACAYPRDQATFRSHVTTTKKKTRGKAGHAQNLLPDRAFLVSNKHCLHNFRLCMRTPREPRRDQISVTSGSHVATTIHVTLSLPVKSPPLGRIWCNFRLRMRRTYFRTMHMTYVTSGHVTDVISGYMTSGRSSLLLRKCGFVRPDILL